MNHAYIHLPLIKAYFDKKCNVYPLFFQSISIYIYALVKMRDFEDTILIENSFNQNVLTHTTHKDFYTVKYAALQVKETKV
jgi:hypothetical protein